ncbi:MAG: formylglycine-generating enzyme family protein [Bacteroidales bacterium]
MIQLKKFSSFSKALTALFIITFFSCEMEEETNITPKIIFQYPQNEQQIFHGAEVQVVAQLKGFTEYRKIETVELAINDSIIDVKEGKVSTIKYFLETEQYNEGSHTISINVEYYDNSPQGKDWNFFGARDYIEDEEEPDSSLLSLEESVTLDITLAETSPSDLEFETIPGETFTYKDKTITLDEFQISKYEITTQQYAEFLNDIEANNKGFYGNIKYIYLSDTANITYNDGIFAPVDGYEDMPVTNVTWHGANSYCQWAGGRLPSQAEWYLAADPEFFSENSYNLDDHAWYAGNSDNRIHQPGTKAANPNGLYDILGNASEWCFDWYADDPYPGDEDTLINPVSNHQRDTKIHKGGNWNTSASEANIELNKKLKASESSNRNGFRVMKRP